jgi:hypothetical protein
LIAQISINKLTNSTLIAKDLLASKVLTNNDISVGLKETLAIGAESSVDLTSRKDGFYSNELVKIPFPKDAYKIKKNLLKLGMDSKVLEFEYLLNKAASEASELAKDILLNEISNIKMNDALAILDGEDNAATKYLMLNTSKKLYIKFKPIVEESIKNVNLVKVWNFLILKYNSIPLTKPVELHLDEYVTKKTIEGLFKLIEIEEKNIRTNPKARITENLQRVFK